MQDLTARLARLTPEQRALFQLRKQRIADDVVIPHLNGEGPWPASLDQTALWFFHKLDPQSTAYNIISASRLRGPLNREALDQAVAALMMRHETLRTRFVEREGRPFQVIEPKPPASLLLLDLSHLSERERMSAVHEEIARSVGEPFDLARGPLIRLPLLRLTEQDHILVVNLHHTTTDWISYGNLFSELFTLYRAFLKNEPSPLEPLPIQFRDYAVWRNQWLESEDFRKQLAYWRKTLADAPMVFDTPIDKPRPAQQSFRGARAFFKLPKHVSEGLWRLNRETKASSLMTTLAATFAFLHRLTAAAGQAVDDILIGTGVANRDQPETRGLIGYLLNIVVIRGDISGDPSFRELIQRIRTQALAAFEHKDLPFRSLVETLNPARDMSRSPVYQIEFNYVTLGDLRDRFTTDKADAEQDPDMFTPEPFNADRHSCSADMQISFLEAPDTFELWFEYAADLYNRRTIDRFGAWMMHLMEAMVAEPDRPLSAAPLVPESELQPLRQLRNASTASMTLLHEGFERQARTTPDAVAVADPLSDGRILTYAALDRAATHLAAALQAAGAGPERVVAVCLNRTPDLIVALLGVLKSGAAYLPLDPQAPENRRKHMLQAADAALVVTEPLWFGDFTDHPCISPTPQTKAEYRSPQLLPDHPAYVIFTSGSTGRPKGVVVTHRGVANFICWLGETFNREHMAHAVCAATVAFDMSVIEIFTTLSVGGCLVMLEDVSRLAELKAETSPTFLMAAPSAVTALLEGDALPTSLATLAFGGEALPAALLNKVRKRVHLHEIYNLYGPTEISICALATGLDPNQSGDPPIGRPVAGAHIFLLDAAGDFTPPGLPGELYLAGIGVARGYVGDPRETAQRFLPHAFAENPGERWYRTGDIVKLDPTGDTHFIGRHDHQIKLRGHRIELAEIETVLRRHTAVAEVALLHQADPRPHLIAFWCGGDIDESQLRRFAKDQLPEYMVPSRLIRLDELPKLPSGKLDRRNLAEHRPDLVEPNQGYRAPSSVNEERLCTLWAELLKRQRVGVDDNFFSLGGDSILAILMIGKARDQGLTLTLRQVFQNQTIAELARVVRERRGVQAEQGVLTGDVPLTPIQHWFFDTIDQTHWHFAFLLETDVPPTVLEQALTALVEHHDALRLRFERDAQGRAVQTYGEVDDHSPLQIITLAKDEHLAAHTRAHMDQATWDQAFWALHFADTPYVFICAHHLVMDAVSWQLVLRDLTTLCRQIQAQETPQLPSKTSSFRQWAHKLGIAAGSETYESQRAFWRRQSQNSSTPPRENQDTLDHAGDERRIIRQLSKDASHHLRHDVHHAYHTQVEDLIVAATVHTLAHWLGGAVTLDLERHGREDFEDLDISRTVGWFTAMFPMRFDITTGETAQVTSPDRLIRDVKEQLRAVPQGGIGYGLLRHLRTPKDPQLEVTPPISFNYLGQFTPADDGLFRLSQLEPGPLHGPNTPRPHALAVNAWFDESQLHLSWSYNQHHHHTDTIAKLLDRCTATLMELIDHCRNKQEGTYTPSDFRDVKLTENELDDVLDELEW